MGVRVPDDISIVGFDDADRRHCVHPTLTAVCQDAVQLGFEASSRLTRVLTGQASGHFQITAPTFFEVNESTGPPRGGAVRVVSKSDNDDTPDLPRTRAS
jgi:DNA-binding LacI/PurR family transcriptional regulator